MGFSFLVSSLFSWYSYGEIIPTLLTKEQRRDILPHYTTAYPQLVTTRPYFIGNYPGLEVGLSFSYHGLSDLQNNFAADDIRNEYVLTQLFIKKSLVQRLELTFSTTISSLGTTQVSGFGGMITWHPFDINDSSILPFIGLYTNFMNYEDALNFQETGLLLKLAKNFKNFSLSAGANFTQFSARFSGRSNGRQITDSNRSEKESVLNQTYFASFHFDWNQYFLALSQNYTLNGGWHPSVVLSYQF